MTRIRRYRYWEDRVVRPFGREKRIGRAEAARTSTGGIKDALRVLHETKTHTISAMPLIVSYRASIARVRQVDRSGQTAFIIDRRVEGKEGMELHWDDVLLDAYSVRDEFFAVRTERQALDFLRHTGEFLPYTSEVSWSNFQQWHTLATQIREWSTLSAAHRTWLSDSVPPSPGLRNTLSLLAGQPHEYFGPPPPPISEHDLAQLRRTAAIDGEHPESLVVALRKGEALGRRRQRDLERWFAQPPAESYSIEFIPKNPTQTLRSNLQKGGALVEFLAEPDELRPILVVTPRCTLEAIAATIYVERIAGVRAGKCPGCGRVFEIRKQKTKTYCDDPKCKERVKKQNQRNKARQLEPQSTD